MVCESLSKIQLKLADRSLSRRNLEQKLRQNDKDTSNLLPNDKLAIEIALVSSDTNISESATQESIANLLISSPGSPYSEKNRQEALKAASLFTQFA